MNVNELMQKKTVVMGKEFPTVALVAGALLLVTAGTVVVAKSRKKTA